MTERIFGPNLNFQDIPGKVVVTVCEVEVGHPLGKSIAQLRQQHGGDEWTIVDEFRGETHLVSITPWSQADPDHTFLLVAVGFEPEHPLVIPPQMMSSSGLPVGAREISLPAGFGEQCTNTPTPADPAKDS